MDASAQEDRRILGRGAHDSNRLFPRYTSAEAAAKSEVVVNGKVLRVWEYSQLEPLSTAALQQRVITIRDIVGEANCPKMPSAQPQDKIRWILHMQKELAQQRLEPGIPKPGRDHAVPHAFWHETKDRPLTGDSSPSPRGNANRAPFGPRVHDERHVGKRDSYRDLVEEANEYADPEAHARRGIQSMRPGGEGRRHIHPSGHMLNSGTAAELPQNVGRRFLGCKDNFGEQLREQEAASAGGHGGYGGYGPGTGPAPASASARAAPTARAAPAWDGGGPVKHVSQTHMAMQGFAAPKVEPPIGGERRKHANPPCHMVCPGTSSHQEDPSAPGRRHLDGFRSRNSFSDTQGGYQSNWKKDPSRLHGTSLIV